MENEEDPYLNLLKDTTLLAKCSILFKKIEEIIVKGDVTPVEMSHIVSLLLSEVAIRSKNPRETVKSIFNYDAKFPRS